MAIETHIVERPAWIDALVETVREAVNPRGFMGRLGYQWWEPENIQNAFDGWCVAVYPTLYRYTDDLPESRHASGFELDLAAVQSAFAELDSVCWQAPVEYNGDLDCPAISIYGTFVGKRVWLRVFQLPPADEPVAFLVDRNTGQATEI